MKTATLAIARSCRNRLDSVAGCMRFAGGALPLHRVVVGYR